MSLNKLIEDVSKAQLQAVNNTSLDDVNIEASNTAYKGIDTRKISSSIINSIFANGDINIADVDTRYIDAVNLPKVKNWKVAQIGAGGIGSPTVQTLVGMGITDYTLFDDDIVEVHNCGPQMHPITNIGKPKVQSTAEQMYAFRGVIINEKNERVNGLKDLMNNDKVFDVIINSVDNMDIRRTLGWELLTPVFNEYKGYKIIIPEVGHTNFKYNIDNGIPIEYAIPSLLNDIHKITKHLKEKLHVKNTHEYVYINVKDLQLSNITINMFKYINSVCSPFVEDIYNSDVHISNINKDNISISSTSHIASKYFKPPFIYDDIMCISVHTLSMLLLTIDVYFIHSQMYANIYSYIYTNSLVEGMSSVDINNIKQPLFNTMQVDTTNKAIILPIYPVHKPREVKQFINNINNLCNYVTQKVPEVYIDSRMSLGTWNTYTLLLKDALYQSIYLYWHVVGSDYNGSEYFEVDKYIPDAFMKIMNININHPSLTGIKQAMFLSNKWGINSMISKGDDYSSEYITNLLYSKASSSLCLCEFLTEALFDSSEAIQEPCTARAIVYTGVNIASYIGAILHYISSRPYAPGDIRYFVKSLMNNDSERDAFSPERIFNQDIIDSYNPFRWRHTFNSRSFLSSNDASLSKTVDFMNRYRDNYNLVNKSLDMYINNIKSDVHKTFSLQNIAVIDYIGAVLHKVTENYKYADTCELLDIHKNTENNRYTLESGLVPEDIILNDTQIGYLYTIWLLWLLSAGYISVEDLASSSNIADKVPYIHEGSISVSSLQNMLIGNLLDIDSYLWDKIFNEDDDTIGNSLLTIMPSYRQAINSKDTLNSILDKFIDIKDLYKIFANIINKHILQIMIDSNALGLTNIAPDMYRNLNINTIAYALSDTKKDFNLGVSNDAISILRKEDITISEALIMHDMSLSNLYSIAQDKASDAPTTIGINKDNYLLKVYTEQSIGVKTVNSFLIRVHYPIQFLCNTIYKNSLSNLGSETNKQQINNITKALLNLQNEDIDKYGDTYIDDISVLYSSNALKCNGTNTEFLVDKLNRFVVFTETNIRTPMSFDNYMIYDFDKINNVYTRIGSQINIHEEIETLKKLSTDEDTTRLLRNIYSQQLELTLHDSIINSPGMSISDIYSNYRDVTIKFPIMDSVVQKENKHINASIKRIKMNNSIIPFENNKELKTSLKYSDHLEYIMVKSLNYLKLMDIDNFKDVIDTMLQEGKKYTRDILVHGTDEKTKLLSIYDNYRHTWYTPYLEESIDKLESGEYNDDINYGPLINTVYDLVKNVFIYKAILLWKHPSFTDVISKGIIWTAEVEPGAPLCVGINDCEYVTGFNDLKPDMITNLQNITLFGEEYNTPNINVINSEAVDIANSYIESVREVENEDDEF